MGTFREDQSTFLIVYRSFVLRTRNVADKCCRENQNHILCSVNFSNIVQLR